MHIRTVAATDAEGNQSAVPVEFCGSNLYVTCDKAVDLAVKVVDALAAVTLREVAPTGSFTEGDGCGAVDEPVFSATVSVRFTIIGIADLDERFANEAGNDDLSDRDEPRARHQTADAHPRA
ncbi:MAG: hypothetical protein ACI970_000304 [Myxococcota bacterium]